MSVSNTIRGDYITLLTKSQDIWINVGLNDIESTDDIAKGTKKRDSKYTAPVLIFSAHSRKTPVPVRRNYDKASMGKLLGFSLLQH